jgi:hypothetical protein
MLLLRTIRRSLFALVGAAVLIALTLPWGLYWLGLSGIEGRPKPPVQLASPEDQMRKWAAARGVGAPEVPHLNPYSYVGLFLDTGPNKAGVLVAWWEASDFLIEHQRHRGMGWWHLSGAALTIWLTRNWTPEQLLSAKGRGSAG